MADSIQLSSFMHTPGVFFNDNPYVYPHEPLKSDDDDISYAPFHCHNARDAKTEVLDDYYAGHIIYGDSRSIKVGLKGPANSNKWNYIAGSGLLFTGYKGPYRKDKHNDRPGSDGDQQSGSCLQLMSQNTIGHPYGLLLGMKLPDEILLGDMSNTDDANAVYEKQARWCSPLGVQFKWSSRGGHQNGASLRFSRIGLIYMDNWMPGRTLYMPLVDAEEQNGPGQFLNSKSYYRGSEPFNAEYNQNVDGDNQAQGLYGEVVAYAEPEVRDYMAEPFTRAVCVGMYIEVSQPKGNTGGYNLAREIFDFKFLFDMPDEKGNMFAGNSMFIYPAPYPLKEAFDSNNIKLL